MGIKLQPIRDLSEVYRISRELENMTDERGRRMYLMWVVGINLGLRIGDLTCLKVGDLRKDEYTFLPQKQRHKRMAQSITIPIPTDVKRAIRERCADLPDDARLLPSRKKKLQAKKRPDKNTPPRTNVGAISRQTALRDMDEIAKRCNVNMKIGCHTMRKTFGYHYYRSGASIEKLQEWFYHKHPATTLIYIGIQLDDFKEMVNKSPFRGMVSSKKLDV